MIPSMSSPDRAARADSVLAPSQRAASTAQPGPDQISTESASFLKTALGQLPEVRPEVVARARALATDPTYPSTAVMRSVAGQIVGSPDLSEDES
jgi:hypothetical protein